MQLILLWRFLNWLARVFPERRYPPELSRYEYLIAKKERREMDQKAQADDPSRLPPE